MSKYKMVNIYFENGREVIIPQGSVNIEIKWDTHLQNWRLLYLELVQV